MRALTIRQPWASLIASGAKRLENRSWSPPADMIGQRIAIHAGQGWDGKRAQELVGCDLRREDCPAGLVVCTAVIDSVVDHSEDPYWIGPLAWVLRDVEQATSPPTRGKLGLWRMDQA